MEDIKIRQASSNKLVIILSSVIALILSYGIYNYQILFKIPQFKLNALSVMILSLLGMIITFKMIPPFMEMFLKKKIQGVDINKVEDYTNLNDPNRKIVPESLGLVPSVVFIVIMILYLFLFKFNRINDTQQLASILVSIIFMILLGFVDDTLDLRWRYKLILPAISSIPIVIAYSGVSTVQIPNFLQFIFDNKEFLELGLIYQVYISMLSIFCTNAINIYAGINGLEVGQSIIISLSMILYNLIHIVTKYSFNGSIADLEHNIDSIIILSLFLGVTLPLFYYNSYPSDCFIGDTFCYFAGITLACAAIIGKFEYTALLFFIPQIINFLLSLPQLIGIIPCPRHRLPKFDSKTKKLNSKVDQLNLLNQGLRLLGPTREQDLCNIAIVFQIACTIIGLLIRMIIYPNLFN